MATTNAGSEHYEKLPMIGNKVERRRRMIHGSQESRHLASMMGGVIDDVEQKYPYRLMPLVPLQILVGQAFRLHRLRSPDSVATHHAERASAAEGSRESACPFRDAKVKEPS